MVLIILEIIGLECHQAEDSSLLRLGGHFVIVERLCRELGCLFGSGAFTLGGRIIACFGCGCDVDYLGFSQGCVLFVVGELFDWGCGGEGEEDGCCKSDGPHIGRLYDVNSWYRWE